MKRRLTALIGKHRYSVPLAMVLLASLVGVAVWGAARAASAPANVMVVSDQGDPFSYTDTQNNPQSGTAVYTYGHVGCTGLDANNFCNGGVWPKIDNAHWIWVAQQAGSSEGVLNPVTFTKTFTLGKNSDTVNTGTIQITADNHFALSVNGQTVGFGDDFQVVSTFDIHSYLHGGQNTIQVVGINDCCVGPNNPAGIIFRADITYTPTDTTPPKTTASIAPTSPTGNHGWYRGPVTLTLTATDPDDTSELTSSYSIDGGASWQTYDSPVVFTNDGKYSVLYYSTDRAGNQEAVQTTSFNIDQTPPTLNISDTNSRTSFDFCSGTLPTRPTFTATDNLSGVDTSNSGDSWAVPISADGVGAYTYAAQATDMAGNPASETRTYPVQYGAAFGGVLPPVDPSSPRTFGLGSTIPVKFQLMCNGTPVTNAGVNLYVQLAGSTGTPGAAISTSAATTGNAFRYDPTSQQYIFNLSTKNGYVGADGSIHPYAAGSWTLTIQLDDGTSRTCTIQLVA